MTRDDIDPGYRQLLKAAIAAIVIGAGSALVAFGFAFAVCWAWGAW